jgi:zinc protease
MIESYYGKLPFREVPRRDYAMEQPQTVSRSALLKKDVQNTSYVVAFQGPRIGDPDMYPLDLAANILGNGTSSRLHRKLVYNMQEATSAYAYSYSMKDHGVFAIGVNLKPGLEKERTLGVLFNELFKLRSQKVSEKELEKAKTQ